MHLNRTLTFQKNMKYFEKQESHCVDVELIRTSQSSHVYAICSKPSCLVVSMSK